MGLTLCEAEEFISKSLESTYATRQNLGKISDSDTKNLAEHIGKWHLIHLLTQIYDVKPEDVKIKRDKQIFEH